MLLQPLGVLLQQLLIFGRLICIVGKLLLISRYTALAFFDLIFELGSSCNVLIQLFSADTASVLCFQKPF